ncbi:MAG: stage V sporulation protein T [Clostridia bacterium]|nr:stage V sporulation protein T [Clostridia bacterium]
MKATGIVRRIDDLGRVVIPKEIRRTLRIREGDPLEIFTEKDGEVIFKKYSPIGELSAFASEYAETLAKTSGHAVCITDKDAVIAVSGASKKEFWEKRVSPEVEQLIQEKISFTHENEGKTTTLLDNTNNHSVGLMVPIVADGDGIGSVIFFKPNDTMVAGESEVKLAQVAAGFLGKQIGQ